MTETEHLIADAILKEINKEAAIEEAKKAKEAEAQQLLDSIDGYLLKELGITMPNINAELTDRIFYVNYSDLSNRLDPYYSLKYFQKSFEAVHSGKYPVLSLKSLSTLITAPSVS